MISQKAEASQPAVVKRPVVVSQVAVHRPRRAEVRRPAVVSQVAVHRPRRVAKQVPEAKLTLVAKPLRVGRLAPVEQGESIIRMSRTVSSLSSLMNLCGKDRLS